MNNIEKSIRHLQSSIAKRSDEIRATQEDIVFTLDLAKSTTKNCTVVDYIKNDWRAHYMWKRHLEYLIKQQKIEKKMLAMMFLCKNALHNKKVVYPREMDIL